MRVVKGFDTMPVDGVILAAGLSTRAGSFKMSLPLGGKPLLESTIAGMTGICSRIIVVGGHRFEEIEAITRGNPHVTVVYNKDYLKGMFTSIKEGVKHLEGERFFIIPGDCPLVKNTVYHQLLRAHGDIVIPYFGGRKGHPVLLKSSLAREILLEPDESNLKEFIRRKGYELVSVSDDGILLDIDTPADYESVKNRYEKSSGPE